MKDLREQLINIDEILTDSYLVHTLLRGLPYSYQSFGTILKLLESSFEDYLIEYSYQSFGTTLRLLESNTPNAFTFDNLVGLLLNE